MANSKKERKQKNVYGKLKRMETKKNVNIINEENAEKERCARLELHTDLRDCRTVSASDRNWSSVLMKLLSLR